MGRIYRDGGSGVPSDTAKAEECLKKGFDVGDESCATLLGDFYIAGYGHPSNEKHALEWLDIGARKNDMIALYRLAEYYGENPDPVKRDLGKALEYADRLMEMEHILLTHLTAVAYARAGRFHDAIKIQTKVVVVSSGAFGGHWKEEELNKEARHRLELYKQNKPYPSDS